MALQTRMPADFEKHSAILLGCNQLLPYDPQATLDIIASLIGRIAIIALVNDEDQRRQLITLACDWGLPAHLLHFVRIPATGMWVRDYGPGFVRANGRACILDPEYVQRDRPDDDIVPAELASLLGVPMVKVPLTVEGGNILSNGQGLCVTTPALMQRNARRGFTREQTLATLQQYYGFEGIAVVKYLEREPTRHVDMFATFVSENTVLVGQYDPGGDKENAALLDEVAGFLSTTATRAGRLNVVRIPMPPNRDGVWRSYTNVIYANDAVLVPTYSDVHPRLQECALTLYSKLLPGWKIVGIEADFLIRSGGALRCASLNIPWLENRFPQPTRWDRGRYGRERFSGGMAPAVHS